MANINKYYGKPFKTEKRINTFLKFDIQSNVHRDKFL